MWRRFWLEHFKGMDNIHFNGRHLIKMADSKVNEGQMQNISKHHMTVRMREIIN